MFRNERIIAKFCLFTARHKRDSLDFAVEWAGFGVESVRRRDTLSPPNPGIYPGNSRRGTKDLAQIYLK